MSNKIEPTDELFNENNFEPETTSNKGLVVDNNGVQISQFSPEWNDYVLSLLEADELDGNYPKVDGLRRVAQLLYGPFLVSEAMPIETPSVNNGFTAIVAYKIITCDSSRNFTEVADCNQENTEAPFYKHAIATASTKAEGRALRKLLNLRKPSAEEIITNPPELDDEDAEAVTALIKDFQINRIDLICGRTDINVMKFVNSGSNKFSKIEEIPYSVAKKMFSVLTEYQRESNKIPESIRGYENGWRDNL